MNAVHFVVNVIHTSFPPKTKREQHRAVTFDRIVEAAMKRLAKGGLESLTMQGLADELGFAVGAVYRYFPGKDGIVVAVQRRIIETVAGEFDDALAKAEAHVAKAKGVSGRQAALLRLWTVALVYESLAKKRPTEFGLLSMTLGDPRQLVQDEDAGALLPALTRLFARVGALFVDAEAAGALAAGDVGRRTMVLWTAVQGALQLKKLERFDVGALKATDVLDEATGTLLKGWGAPADDTDAARVRARQLMGRAP